MGIRERLARLGKTQNWLILEMHKHNVRCNTSELSYILSGILTTPKAEKVLTLCDKILTEYEKEVEANAGS